MLEEAVKLYLGDIASQYTDLQIELCVKDATNEVLAYTNRTETDDALDSIIVRIAVIKINRLHSEGLTSQNYGGVSENYIDGYPQDIVAVLNRKRIAELI